MPRRRCATVFAAGRAHGRKTFLVYEDERATFEAFARAALAVADDADAAGRAQGRPRRDHHAQPARVAGGLLRRRCWPGAIVTPLNAWWTGPELEYGLTDSGAKIAIVDAERCERMAGARRQLPGPGAGLRRRAPTATIADPRVARLEDVIGRSNDWGDLPDRPLPAVALEPDDDATILYTSGTTGKPKGALGTHRNVDLEHRGRRRSRRRANFLRRGEPPPAARSDGAAAGDPVWRAVLPRHRLLRDRWARRSTPAARSCCMRRWDAEPAMRLIEREKRHSRRRRADHRLAAHRASGAGEVRPLVAGGGRLRRRAVGAGAGAQHQARSSRSSQPGNGWGMTETSATVTSHGAEDYENRPDSCGPALPVVRAADRRAGRRRDDLPRRRGRRALGQGPEGREGLLEQARGHGRDLRRRLAAHRRPRAPRRGGLPLHHRPGQGHADPRRREHLLRRGRERALRPPRRDGRRRWSASRTRRSARSRPRWCT